MIRRILWPFGLLLVLIGANFHDPYFVRVRPWALPLMLIVSATVFVWLALRWPRKITWVLLCGAILVATLGDEGAYLWRKRAVVAEAGPEATDLGQHFVIGYTNAADIAPLAARGLIGGIYVTRRNLPTLRRDIADLQTLRRANGLPPLLVATDQEGGIVSHLAPLLPAMPPLADLTALPAGERGEAARRYGYSQGRGLAGIGVTVDFSPVVDLKGPPVRLDYNSLISQRAIAADPAVVTEIAEGYSKGLESAGVTPTLKHFPGLGRAQADTHHVRARYTAGIDDLEASDWRPFRRVLADTDAFLMVGHVTLAAVDPDHPASTSRKVIDGIIRQQWGFDGIVITDDLSMPSVLHHGFCTAVTDALNAGADLLLISFDGEQYYRAMDCTLAAHRQGQLNEETLARSSGRLSHSAAIASGQRENEAASLAE